MSKAAVGVDHEAMENSPPVKAFFDNKRLFYWNTLWFIFGSAAAAFGQNTAMSLMPLHMASIGLTAQKISIIIAIGGCISMPLILYGSYLSDHWQWKMGRRLPFILISLPFITVAIILFPYASFFWTCLLAYCFYTFFFQIKYNAYPYLLSDIAKQKYWGRVTGIGGVLQSVALWLGQIILMPMVATRGVKTTYMVAALTLLIASVLTIIFARESPFRSPEPPAYNPLPVIIKTLKVGFSSLSSVMVFIAFAFVTAQSLFFNYVPLQAKVNLGLSEGDIGTTILQYGTLTGAVFAPLIGWLIDRIGTIKCMLIGLFFCFMAALVGTSSKCSAHVLSWLIPGITPVVTLSLAYVLQVMAFGFIYSSAVIFTMSSVDRENIASFCACNGAVNLVCQAVLGAIVGTLITRVFDENYGIAFVVELVFATGGVFLFFIVDRQRANAGQSQSKISLNHI